MKYILSLSGGKDSVALLLYLIEDLQKKEKDRRYPLDEVIYCEMVEWEFESIPVVVEQCKDLCIKNNIKFTKLVIETEESFNKWGFCGGVCRYGTTMKINTMAKYYRDHYQDEVIIEYLGYAEKEEKRINRYFNKVIKLYPLIENNISENDCLVKCYKNHIHWWEINSTGERVELYDYIDRVSCFCCKNKNLKELEMLYNNFPQYWIKIKDMQRISKIPFKKEYLFEELERKFSNKHIEEFNLFNMNIK